MNQVMTAEEFEKTYGTPLADPKTDLTPLLETMKQAKRFDLDVEKAQSFYDSLEKDYPTISELPFKLPFDNCVFIFHKPIDIRWGRKSTNWDYKWSGFHFEKRGLVSDSTPVDEKGGYVFTPVMEMEIKEDDGSTKLSSLLLPVFCAIFNYSDKNRTEIFYYKHDCQNETLCCVSDMGRIKKPFLDGKYGDYVDKKYFCQTILNYDSVLETAFFILNKIHTSTPIFKQKEKSITPINGETKYIDSMPFGWPWTKGNLPKDGYTQYLDGKHYVYDKDDEVGNSGRKVRYRFDVRRHPRVVNGHIIWIEPHQRGAGRYIPKVYSNRKTWFVPYMYQMAEKLTKYRVFEILLIKFINIFKK